MLKRGKALALLTALLQEYDQYGKPFSTDYYLNHALKIMAAACYWRLEDIKPHHIEAIKQFLDGKRFEEVVLSINCSIMASYPNEKRSASQSKSSANARAIIKAKREAGLVKRGPNKPKEL